MKRSRLQLRGKKGAVRLELWTVLIAIAAIAGSVLLSLRSTSLIELLRLSR